MVPTFSDCQISLIFPVCKQLGTFDCYGTVHIKRISKLAFAIVQCEWALTTNTSTKEDLTMGLLPSVFHCS